jgi:DnaJ-class molecular chaperone with C-terminal Zn finger domain
MAMFDNFGKKIGDLAQNAVKKSGEMVEVTKLNINIKTEEESIDKLYDEIGKYCYVRYEAGNENDSSIIEICGKIKDHKEKISALKEKINEIKNVFLCEKCGGEISKTSTFCGNCGAKVEVHTADVNITENNTIVCPSCNKTVEEGKNFCPECGTKVR